MQEILKAIEEKDCKKVATLLYNKVDSLEDEELKEVLEKAEKLAIECEDFELYKLTTYYFHEILGIDKVPEFEKRAEEKETFDAKFQLADLYYMIGELEKSLELYRALLEEETAKGNLEHVGRIYYNIALVHEELQEYDKSLQLMEKAEEAFRNLGDEEDLLRVQIHHAYVKFEAGDTYEAKAMLAGLLSKIIDKRDLIVEVHLSFEEIFEEDEDYDAALQECLYAMLFAKGTDYEEIAFGSLMDVLWQLFLEDDFETIYLNIDMFSSAFPDMKDFFDAVKAIALFKDDKMEEEEVSKYVEKVTDQRQIDLLELLGEAEL
ncbi:tetratricopeptide repeat protein [Thermococcus sp.]|uniref:tetratricopeptide repeat protein n=1 Tax=Thermococcus sp. TaxID=35749 RepID=UPI00261CFCA0|nr:tetratricopeptide repeat protein [Thermococcus sp.]